MKVVLALAPVWESITPPLALAFLKGSLQQAGYECKCIDFSVQFRPIMVSVLGDKGAEDYIKQHPKLYKNWAKQICDQKPDIIGFSLLGSNLTASALIAKEIRNILPDVMIISGGSGMTRENEGCINKALAFSDYVIEGEGEKILVEFVQCYEQNGDFSKLKQIWTKDKEDNLHYTGHSILQNIDTIPYPDFTDFDMHSYACPERLPLLFSRGCILNCNYCENKWNHLTQRSRGGRNVFDELKHHVKKYGIKEYMFNDDSLISSKTMRQMDEYCDLVISEGLVMPWSVYGTRVERLITQPFLNKLRRSGMERVSLGVESFSSRVQKEMGKSSRYDDADKMCRMFAEEGIKTESWIIYGYPTETDADFDETLQWFVKNPNILSHVTVNSFGPNHKYMHDRPGVAHFYSSTPGMWEGGESTLEKRKERFLALMDVLEPIRKARRGSFTMRVGDPLYVKYFTSWTKRDKELLLDSWEKIEAPELYKAKHTSIFNKALKALGFKNEAGEQNFAEPTPVKKKENLPIKELSEMKKELYGKIRQYLAKSEKLSAKELEEKMTHYISCIENTKIHLTDNITEEIFFALALQGDDIRVMLEDLDTHAPEYIAQRILEASVHYILPEMSA